MSYYMIRIRTSDTHTLYLPANRVHLDDLRIDGDKWEYTLRVGQPFGEEYQ